MPAEAKTANSWKSTYIARNKILMKSTFTINASFKIRLLNNQENNSKKAETLIVHSLWIREVLKTLKNQLSPVIRKIRKVEK